MSGGKASWTAVLVVCFAASACGNNVTVGETGGGGTSATAAGGAGAGDEGGASAMGGASMGGSSAMGGAGAAGGAGGAGGEPTCPGAGDVCTECLSNDCPAVYCGCYEQIHCTGYLQCLGTCMAGDTACSQNCATVHQDGISIAILTADCAATVCDGSCNFGKPLAGCQKCLYTECAPQMNACIADAECVALIQCLQTCAPGDMACSQACLDAHPDGLPEALEVRDCRVDLCPDSCN